MIRKIKEDVWQMTFSEFGSAVYALKIKGRIIIIDTSSKENKDELEQYLERIGINPLKVDIVILTHNHFDHVGNIDLFDNAGIYGSKEDFSKKKLTDIEKLSIPGLEIIKTPGHTKGGICILFGEILFSGDTIFQKGGIGRMDLPGGSEEEMKITLEKLSHVKFNILAPGHL